MNQINSVWLLHELHSARTRVEGSSQAKTCLDHWSLGFGYCLFFVIWYLEFIKFKDSAYLDTQFNFFTIFVGHNTIRFFER